MPLLSVMVHPRSMDFDNQMNVVKLRKVEKMKWADIRLRVVNLEDEHPSVTQIKEVYRKFNSKLGFKPYRYHKCGRKVEKLTKSVENYLIKRLLALRMKKIVTSTVLQAELMRERGVQLECSTIRKCLSRNGYHWLPRSQKPKYSSGDRALRVAFAERVLRMTKKDLQRVWWSLKSRAPHLSSL